MKASLLLLCAALLFTSGCTTPVDEQAALICQYRKCLALAENNPRVNCSGYRTAVEELDARSD